MVSICGFDCTKCDLNNTCKGCIKTNGRPFGGDCVIAKCCQNKGHEHCEKCLEAPCKLKEELISEFNSLGIENMEKVTDLNALRGIFVNLEYTFPNGQVAKLLDDNKIYLGNQICKKDGTRCYGLCGDESHILVCEYGVDGSNPEIIVYKKRK